MTVICKSKEATGRVSLRNEFRPAGNANVRMLRVETWDQDNKQTVTYTNAIGQNVASLRYNDNGEKIITLFVYDSYGNLTKVINPEKQKSEYVYNRLVQLVIEKTVDAGSKHYMYNEQGFLYHLTNKDVGRFRAFRNKTVPILDNS